MSITNVEKSHVVFVLMRKDKKFPLPGRGCPEGAGEERGRLCPIGTNAKTHSQATSKIQPESRSDPLYLTAGYRPHSSSDPLTRATFPPGEGIFTYQRSACRHQGKIPPCTILLLCVNELEFLSKIF